jgi:ABC-type antimicrobial peptide transport system permease subunit
MDAVFSTDVRMPERRPALNEVLAALGTVPGVQAAAVAMKAPLRGPGDSFGITIEGKESLERTSTYFRIVTRDYFNALSFRVLKGRTFDASDRQREDEISVIINESLAQRYFPGEDPLGKRVGGGFGVPERIIGVVANVAEAALTDERTPVRYYYSEQAPWFGTNASFVMQTRSDAVAETVLDDARNALNRVAPGLAVQNTTTMTRVFDTAVGPARQIMSLLALLSALALVLGAIGIYGVISHSAQRRRRDWAIRVALGLTSRRVVSQIVGQAAMLVMVGIVIGVAGTVALSRLLSSFLFGVSNVDPIALLASGGALLITGLVAAFVPAWRAGTVDPALVLREEA